MTSDELFRQIPREHTMELLNNFYLLSNDCYAQIVKGALGYKILRLKELKKLVQTWANKPFTYTIDEEVKTKKGTTVKEQTKSVNPMQVYHESVFRRDVREIDIRPDLTFDEALDEGILNLWYGYGVQPDETKSYKKIVNHIVNRICDGDKNLATYIIHWLAWIIQNPTKIPLTALVLVSETQGSGKTIFVDNILGKIFGAHYVQITNSKSLAGNFNSELMGARLVNFDEATFGGNRSDSNILKTFITSDKRRVEYKGKEAITVRNLACTVITSNQVEAVNVESSDRRFIISKVKEERMPREEVDNLLKEIANGGCSGFLHFLQNITLPEDYSPLIIPSTALRDEMKINSLDVLDKFAYSHLKEGTWKINDGELSDNLAWRKEGTVFSNDDWFAAFKTMEHPGVRWKDKVSFFKRLKQVGLIINDYRPRFKGEQVACKKVPPLHDARKAFCKYHDLPISIFSDNFDDAEEKLHNSDTLKVPNE